MVLYKFGDIFQDKVENLLSDIDGVKMYINFIMVLGKGIPPPSYIQDKGYLF